MNVAMQNVERTIMGMLSASGYTSTSNHATMTRIKRLTPIKRFLFVIHPHVFDVSLTKFIRVLDLLYHIAVAALSSEGYISLVVQASFKNRANREKNKEIA